MRYVQRTLSRVASLAPRRRTRRAALTASIAGTPIGARSLDRRGSVLVLILGTLALMTVLAVVYVGIGKGDRQNARAIEANKESKDVPRQVADYIADVIARDALATMPTYEGVVGSAPATAHRREAFDSPSSDSIYRSDPTDDSNELDPWVDDVAGAVSEDGARRLLRFRPEGDHPILFDDAAILGAGVVNALRGAVDFDRRVGSDPWLSSPEPVNLDQHLPFNNRDDGNLPDPPDHPTANYTEAQLAWYYNRDWLQISNVAPDGRAVNLFNLRNNFDAVSATGNVQNSISSNLTLFGDIFEPYTAGSTQFLWDSVTPADFNRPDHWFTNQRGAFRAMSDVDRNWSAPEFLHYQYADADGDGMVDSRWIELIDATDPSSPIQILNHDGDIRYFVAARAEDLSGRVNVNIAKSGAMPPTRDEPIGYTPGDIDLMRILSLEDAWSDTLWAYTGLEFPRLDSGGIDVESPANYANYDPFNTSTGEFLLQHVGQAGYDAVQLSSLLGIVPPQDVVVDLTAIDDAMYLLARDEFGLDVFIQFQDGRERLIPSSPRLWRHSPLGRSLDFAVAAGAGRGGAYADPLGDGRQRLVSDRGFGLGSLGELLTYRGVNDPEVTSDLEAAIGGRYDGDSFEGFFTLNLDPLRSNRPLSIERGDHDAFDALYGGGGMGGGGNTGGTPDGVTDADAMILEAVDARRRITTASWHRPMQSAVVGRPWMATDDHGRLLHLTDEQANDLQRAGTFVSASSELRAHVEEMTILERATWDSSDADYFGPDGLVLVPLADNPKALFELYADSLLPYSGVVGSWPSGGIGGGGGNYNADTLHYGYRGAELALLTSAHMTLNLADMLDTDSIQSAATLLIDELAFDTLNDDEDRQPNQRVNAWSFWPSAFDPEDGARRVVGMKLDLNHDRNGDGDRAGENDPNDPEARLANSAGRTGETPSAAAVNVFGIEAQPFITEVSTMFAYHDTPDSNVGNGFPTGDDDVDDPQMPGLEFVTLDFSLRDQNPDFLFWVIAVQLTNPFDEPVKIGRYVGDPNDPDDREALYYLELNGTHFPLAGVPMDCYDYLDQACLGNPDGRNGGGLGGGGGGGGANNELWSDPGIVINPGESKVFLIPSQPLWYIEDRLEHRLGQFDPATKDITQIGAILKTQFGATVSGSVLNDEERLGENTSNIVILDPAQANDMTQAPFPEGQYPGAQTDTTLLRFDELMAAPDGQSQGSEIPYELRLWRAMRQESIETDPSVTDKSPRPINEFGAGGPASNLVENDLLADRMHINVFSRPGGGIGGGGANPWFAVLDRRLNDPVTPGPEDIDEAYTWLGENDFGIGADESYDGLAMISYATVSRPQDEAPGGQAMPQRVPWYALEAKHRWKDWNGLGPTELWNEFEPEGDNGDGWRGWPNVDDVNEIDDHLFEGPNGESKVLAFRRLINPAGNGTNCRTGFETLVRILGNDHDESGSADPCANVNQPGNVESYRATTTGLPILEKDDTGRELTTNLLELGLISVEDLALELSLSLDRDALRPGDFLLPLGVGAVYDPDLAGNGADPQWTTLSEALARVLGFDEVNDTDGNGLIDDDLYAGVGSLRKQDAIALLGDNGGEPGVHDFIEGIVVDPADPNIGRPALDKGHLVLDDFVPFLDFEPQAPVVERFNPADGDIAFGMRLPPAVVLLERVRTLFGDPAMGAQALDSVVPGAVNLNTASRTVLRSLPMLSPSRLDWWGELLDHEPTSDIASTVQAYRDKVAVLFRNFSGGNTADSAVDFAQLDADEFNGIDVPRQNAALVSGLPEERGIRSVGELALMRSLGRPDGSARTLLELGNIRRQNVDRMGYNGSSVGASEGVESVRYGRHVGTVRNENAGGDFIIADFGLSDRDDYYNDWTLTFIASDEPDLIGKSFTVQDYIGNDPQQRTARELALNGPLPARPRNGDIFVLERAARGTVQIFRTDTPNVVIATGNLGLQTNDYAGAELVFHGSAQNSGQTFTVSNSMGFADGRVQITLDSAIPFDPGDERPVVGNAFTLRPPSYLNDEPNDVPADTVREDDRIDDEFDERLAIINSVINTASVRSDLYAVWFLLHGYQESDTQGLGPDDPLLPTIQRRFVMVVDRSNVKQRGDKPKILLFKEVPL